MNPNAPGNWLANRRKWREDFGVTYEHLCYEMGLWNVEGFSAFAVISGTLTITVKGQSVVPRDLFIAAVTPKLHKPEGKDLVALRVEVSGTKNGKPQVARWQLVDRYDEAHGISAMMRTTGYSLSITGQMQADGRIRPGGVRTPDEAVPYRDYVDELAKRGVRIEES